MLHRLLYIRFPPGQMYSETPSSPQSASVSPDSYLLLDSDLLDQAPSPQPFPQPPFSVNNHFATNEIVLRDAREYAKSAGLIIACDSHPFSKLKPHPFIGDTVYAHSKEPKIDRLRRSDLAGTVPSRF
uniref:Uncharacterized protein n=1 Tax=Spongospora subterranea TaxID=70186 RepID=A0A0H5QS86_9EUKA|eukprot:CRZ04536.1 hypothetical protein [Spongospora subterranea]